MLKSVSFTKCESDIAFCRSRPLNVREQFPMLAGFVEEIVDWDFPDTDMARALAIKVLPSTMPYLIIQYREPMTSSRMFLGSSDRHRPYRNVMTKVETGVCTIRPSGPFGAVIVCFKLEASPLLFSHDSQCFADTKVDLRDVFNAQEVGLLEEVVSEVSTSSERLVAVARFLSAHLCPGEPDPAVSYALKCLGRNPSTRVHRLAKDLHMSERQLLRRFRSVCGVTPKQFARCARIEKAVAERSHGADWADVAYGCGFADQAHMIRDFNAILGLPPERALLPASVEQGLIMDSPNGAAIAHDYLIVGRARFARPNIGSK